MLAYELRYINKYALTCIFFLMSTNPTEKSMNIGY